MKVMTRVGGKERQRSRVCVCVGGTIRRLGVRKERGIMVDGGSVATLMRGRWVDRVVSCGSETAPDRVISHVENYAGIFRWWKDESE